MKIIKQLAIVAIVLTCVLSFTNMRAQQKPVQPTVDPEAVRLLKGMTDYLSGLNQFSVTAQNLREDLTISGHRVDFEVTSRVTISRPNKMHGTRQGHLTDQIFYYDGKTLTIFNPDKNVYATAKAPQTIEETLDFARNTLGVGYPISDLIYRNSFPLLMHDMNFAFVIDRESINGVKCEHLLFSRPGVDFQIWVTSSGKPLPVKYIVTDTSTPELLSITTYLSDWDVAPTVTDAQFTFTPPASSKAVDFIPIKKVGGQDR